MAKEDGKGKSNKWTKKEDQQLSELFRKGFKNHGLNPRDLSAKAVHHAQEKFFPGRTYKSFSQLYRRKARAYNLGEALSGARRNCKIVYHGVSICVLALVFSLLSQLQVIKPRKSLRTRTRPKFQKICRRKLTLVKTQCLRTKKKRTFHQYPSQP